MDEANLQKAQYNWGYDPVNYNVPEGSYATDPFHGEVRVKELKQAIKSLHENGISVVMDVVYNHVYHTHGFCMNQIVPGYFSRFDKHGRFHNGSMCGNETASERSMVRKFIVDSVNYWADEYHIDGFRFDIASLLDTDTVNEIIRTVHINHPNVIFYGEGWNMNAKCTKPDLYMTEQQHSEKTPEMAFFNDAIRDTLRGALFDTSANGFLTGNPDCREGMDRSFTASCWWTNQPNQVINYLSCHDNHTLFDRIQMVLPDASMEEKIKRNNLGAAFLFLSQGVPFFQAGEEMMRSKKKITGKYEGNSYKSSDRINAIRWDALNDPQIRQSVEYYRGLIALRKAYPLLRRSNPAEIHTSIVPVECGTKHAVAYMVYDTHVRLLCIFNASGWPITTKLPYGDWYVLVQDQHASSISFDTIHTQVQTAALTATVLAQYQ